MLKGIQPKLKAFVDEHTIWCVVSILLFATAIRVIFWCCNQTAGRDEIYYISNAFNLNVFDDLQGYQPPLAQWLLSKWLAVWSPSNRLDTVFYARMLTMIVGILGVLPFYFIGKTLYEDKSYGLLVMLIAAVHPTLVKESAEFVRESFSLPLSGVVLLMCIRMMKMADLKECIISAVLIGVGEAVRYEFAEWLLYGSIAMWYGMRSRRESWSICVIYTLIGAFCFLASWLVVALMCGDTWHRLLVLVSGIWMRLQKCLLQ